jgi:outer membrane cobalamin receptor
MHRFAIVRGKRRRADRVLVVTLWTAASLLSRQARADDASNAVVWAADDVVVTASRTPDPRVATPSYVTTFSETAIRTAAAHSPDDLLRAASGVSVLRSYGLGYGIPGQINIRGVPGIHGVLLLVDGTPLNEAATGFLGVNEVPMCAVRRMELVRGPYSALYGADAFGGVVQLFTVAPQGPALFEAAGRLGNEGFREAWTQGRGSVGEVGYVVSIDARDIDNYVAHDTIVDRVTDPSTGQTFDVERPAQNYDYRDVRALAKLGMAVGENAHLVIMARFFDASLGYGQTDFRPLYPVPVDNGSDNRTAMLGASLTATVSERTTAALSASYRDQEREQSGIQPAGVVSGVPVFARSTSRTTTSEWRAHAQAAVAMERHTLTVGVDAETVDAEFGATRDADTGQRLSPSGGRDGNADHAGFYVQEEAALTERLQLTAGVRADTHSGFGEVVSPRGGVVYEPRPGTRLHASGGSAYRAPSLLERYQPDVAFGSQVFKANPDLDPETISSTDAGIEQQVGDACVARINVFYNDMNDLIATRREGAVVTFANVDEAWSAGVEAGFDYRVCEAATVFANITEQQTEDRGTKRDLPLVPDRTASFGVRFEQPVRRVMLTGSATANYVSSRGYIDEATGQWEELEPYWRGDAAAQGTLRNGFWLGAGVQNLADTRYQESDVLNPAPGRLWYIEAGVRL